MTDQEQYDRLTRMQFHGFDDLEFKIRQMAEVAVGSPGTYRVGTCFPFLPRQQMYWTEEKIPAPVTYETLCVRLIPELERHRNAALLVAESILRDQIKELV